MSIKVLTAMSQPPRRFDVPDIQYVINPAGGYVNRAGRLSGDALVLGLRTTITF